MLQCQDQRSRLINIKQDVMPVCIKRLSVDFCHFNIDSKVCVSFKRPAKQANAACDCEFPGRKER